MDSGRQQEELYNMDDAAISTAISTAVNLLGYEGVRREQETVLKHFLSVVSLPTGYGKSLCYAALPGAFDCLRSVENKSIAVIVSPLLALIKDQVATFSEKGLKVGYITNETTSEMKRGVKEGQYQLVYFSPESLLGSPQWRRMLLKQPYASNLVGFIVDEAHCVDMWGQDFRRDFSRLGELQSVISSNVNIMALTATASRDLRRKIIDSLNMNVKVVSVNPDKSNICYVVKPFQTRETTFGTIVDTLAVKQTSAGRSIIFCQKLEDCAKLYLFFRSKLGPKFVVPNDAPDIPRFRIVDMFTGCTEPSVKDAIIENFTSPEDSHCDSGMGIDVPDIRNIIHFGAPHDTESYVQAVGRAGRDGRSSCAIILRRMGKGKQHVDEAMDEYSCNDTSCRRDILYSKFDSYEPTSCMCCDVCAHACVCGNCDTNLSHFLFAV